MGGFLDWVTCLLLSPFFGGPHIPSPVVVPSFGFVIDLMIIEGSFTRRISPKIVNGEGSTPLRHIDYARVVDASLQNENGEQIGESDSEGEDLGSGNNDSSN